MKEEEGFYLDKRTNGITSTCFFNTHFPFVCGKNCLLKVKASESNETYTEHMALMHLHWGDETLGQIKTSGLCGQMKRLCPFSLYSTVLNEYKWKIFPIWFIYKGFMENQSPAVYVNQPNISLSRVDRNTFICICFDSTQIKMRWNVDGHCETTVVAPWGCTGFSALAHWPHLCINTSLTADFAPNSKCSCGSWGCFAHIRSWSWCCRNQTNQDQKCGLTDGISKAFKGPYKL